MAHCHMSVHLCVCLCTGLVPVTQLDRDFGSAVELGPDLSHLTPSALFDLYVHALYQ